VTEATGAKSSCEQATVLRGKAAGGSVTSRCRENGGASELRGVHASLQWAVRVELASARAESPSLAEADEEAATKRGQNGLGDSHGRELQSDVHVAASQAEGTDSTADDCTDVSGVGGLTKRWEALWSAVNLEYTHLASVYITSAAGETTS